MSVYTRNAVYDHVYEAVMAAHTNAYVTAVFEPVPASFPAVMVREIGRFHNPANVTFGGSQGVRTSTFEVQIQSDMTDGAMSEAYGILDTVNAAFEELYYVLESVNVIEEGERGVYRLRSAYRKVIGAADQIPESE